MILERITLHNFGLYRDYQEIDLLPPSSDKPIILFGGLNGGGKTTLLDAIQLVLYGKMAYCSNRNNLNYSDYLRQCVHKGKYSTGETVIILDFIHVVNGETVRYRVQRRWTDKVRNITDHVMVWCNGIEDSSLADRWLEFIEEILPSNIAHLFFFDGEKIEAFADPARSSNLLESAMRSLLGLDLVDQLCTDLLALERRHKEKALEVKDKSQIEELHVQIQNQHNKNGVFNARLGTINIEIDNMEKKLSLIENNFEKEGGSLFEQRQELEAKQAHLKGALEETHRELVSIGGDPKTPLLLLQKMLQNLEIHHNVESEHHDISRLIEILRERDAWLLTTIKNLGLLEKQYQEIADTLKQDREKRNIQPSINVPVFQLSRETITYLRQFSPLQLHETCMQIEGKLSRNLYIQEELVQLERLLGAVPESDHIYQMIQERENIKQKISTSRNERSQIQKELEQGQLILERLENDRNRILEKVGLAEIKRIEAQRLLDYSNRSRLTLSRFRESVLNHNIHRIEAMILESFQSLIRKDNFIHSLRIDPINFELSLSNPVGERIEPNRLSAGERQLLAVSMLWGLARASGRTLPIVIDTPLGRLDSQHRTNLIERYFPKASQQVLLLSTDEEIDAVYYQQLKHSVGRTYRLEYNDKQSYTRINTGYFWNEGLEP
jgi:DNA sulfur modification protein DndD